MSITSQIKFGKEKPVSLFAEIAQEAAKQIKLENGRLKNTNKTTQLRKFYDELTLWHDRVQAKREDREKVYQEQAVYIKMLKAKVAYAKARGHVDEDFLVIFSTCIDKIDSADTLKDAKLFMEAVTGFCKLEEAQ